MPIMGFIIPLFIIGIIGIPMLELFIGIGIAFIMMPASYGYSPTAQGLGPPHREHSGWFPLLVRRTVSPIGDFSVATD
jgi:hypothetical protein